MQIYENTTNANSKPRSKINSAIVTGLFAFQRLICIVFAF